MATWKKVLVEDADIQVGDITATLGNVSEIADANPTVNLVTSTTDGSSSGDLGVASVTFGTAAFDAASSFATSAQGTTADNAVQPGDFLQDLVAGTGLSGGANDVLYGTPDGDITINLDISGLTASSGEITVASGDLVALYDADGAAHYKTTVSELVGAVSTGVTSITSGNGLTSNSSAQGAVTINLDTSTLSTVTVAGATEFIVSNSDTEGVAAASAISLAVFDNTTSAFIGLTDLSVGAEGAASGDGSIAYANGTGVFTYTPPDLSSYQTIAADVHADSFAYTGGAASGPTGTLTLSDATTVAFGAIPSAGSSASGIVTTGAQNFAGVKTFDNDLIITGDLTVNGDTTTVSTTNLVVEDRFISLNSGGASNVDAGIVFEGVANKVFGWDQSQESGRFGVDYAGGDASATAGAFDPDAWISVVHTNTAIPTDGTNGDIDALQQIGNIYVNSTNEDIYIYS